MQIGAQADILRHSDAGPDPVPIGVGRVIHPHIVQVDSRTAAAMWQIPHRSEELIIGAGVAGRSYPVDRIRPGLIDSAEAAAILADNLPEVSLLPVDGELVFLETRDRLVAERCCCEDDPWWCRILCRSSCTHC
jgi:hypothetical protein